ncbi:Alpha/beta-Hydrolases superfamily protein isoform 2 [Theobroma cacao]|uniref:Alpha/beta-Hydrolases superfamily protein isoform 2 n=1 Tax=Theobroma cacao TaxID=3641 RepID=A0A061DFJ1_THECC|nr:Alpha/beta-Hydrolases superfamily protein isoform 2 [Theobroma cacao]
MNDVTHQRIKTNGIWLHIAEQGTGPLVLLLHGFPDIWYSWRHQIPFLANHGYHVVAPDLRGYGDSDSPLSPSSYTFMHLVGDIIGLLDHFGEQQAFVVGHDWGAVIAWHLCLFRPERVKGLINISVPYFDRNPKAKYADALIRTYGDGFYISQFQTDNLIAPPGVEIIDYLQTPSWIPPWITEEEIQVYADKFQESGFTGGFNYYRAMNWNWELTAPWQGSKILVPVKFLVGDKDLGFENAGVREYVQGDTFRSLVPNLEVVILDGHHFLQQEKHQEVSQEILSFLRKFPAE